MPVTIRDVAAASGVHMSTVSRTFSAPQLVNPATRDRVLAAAAQLGYRPNRAARALITGRTHNLGLIVADLANPFFPPLIKAAEGYARSRDHYVFVADANEDPVVEEDLVRAMAKQVDGLLLCSPRMSNTLIEQLSREVPMVVVNRSVNGLPCVVMDIAQGAGDAVKHLVSLGHQRLALLGGPRGSWTSREIRKAAVAAARAARVELSVLTPNLPTEEGGLAAADPVLRDGATAVLTYNDLMAIGLMEGLDQRGIVIPDDISVVGIDDIEMSRRTRPKLTTMATPAASAGRAAVDMLLQYGDDRRAAAQVALPTELVIRESTAPPQRRRGRRRDPGKE